MEHQQLIPHLFRQEFSKISAVLCSYLGIDKMDVAEDITSETFLSAMESWIYKGLPANPTAWLYTVAKNKTKNYINRNKLFNEKISKQLQRDTAASNEIDIDLSDQNITDSQLQMLFAICHPILPPEAQVGLALRILCGFGIDEIATAFLSNRETISKRLYRAKEKLRIERVAIAFPGEHEIDNRLHPVLTTLYLLFNEGYYSESSDAILREDLCLEAMRLTHLLISNESTCKPSVNALFALMCFHSSRFPARRNIHGDIILYNQQDEDLWDKELIAKGAYHLNKASGGNTLSRYHLEAGIAYWFTVKDDSPGKWEKVLHCYNQLLAIEYAPVAALNRTYALAKARGNKPALHEALKLQMKDNPFYFALLGDLYTGMDNVLAIQSFRKAMELAKTNTDKALIRKKIDTLLGS